MGDPSAESRPCVIVDISLGGCRAEIEDLRLTPGDRLTLSCVLPTEQVLSEVPCVVRRSYGAHLYGLEFGDLTKRSREALEDFFMILTEVTLAPEIKEGNEGMVGDLADIALPDLLQVLVTTRKSYQVDLTRESNKGRIYLGNGEIIHATTPNQRGVGAIFEMFSWQWGRYHIQKAQWVPERNINTNLEYLSLEYARRLDQDMIDNQALMAQAQRGYPTHACETPEPERKSNVQVGSHGRSMSSTGMPLA
jgi:hypothetical protein